MAVTVASQTQKTTTKSKNYAGPAKITAARSEHSAWGPSLFASLAAVTLSGMSAPAHTTLRAETFWLLEELGLENDAKGIAHTRSEQTPTLTRDERRRVLDLMDAFPERGGPTVSFGVELATEPRGAETAERVSGLLDFTRPADVSGGSGSIGYWMAAMAGARLMGDVRAVRPGKGGKPSPLDLRACLRQVADALGRGARLNQVRAPRQPARCIAVLLWLFGNHVAFFLHVCTVREPKSLQVPWITRAKHAGKAQEEALVHREEMIALVAESAPGVMQQTALSLLTKEVRALARER